MLRPACLLRPLRRPELRLVHAPTRMPAPTFAPPRASARPCTDPHACSDLCAAPSFGSSMHRPACLLRPLRRPELRLVLAPTRMPAPTFAPPRASARPCTDPHACSDLCAAPSFGSSMHRPACLLRPLRRPELRLVLAPTRMPAPTFAPPRASARPCTDPHACSDLCAAPSFGSSLHRPACLLRPLRRPELRLVHAPTRMPAPTFAPPRASARPCTDPHACSDLCAAPSFGSSMHPPACLIPPLRRPELRLVHAPTRMPAPTFAPPRASARPCTDPHACSDLCAAPSFGSSMHRPACLLRPLRRPELRLVHA